MCARCFEPNAPLEMAKSRLEHTDTNGAGNAERSRWIGKAKHYPLDINLLIGVAYSDMKALVEQHDHHARGTS